MLCILYLSTEMMAGKTEIENKGNNRLNSWLLEYSYWYTWEEFSKTRKVDVNTTRDFVQWILTQVDQNSMDYNTVMKSLILGALCMLSDGNDYAIRYSGDSDLTVLEVLLKTFQNICDQAPTTLRQKFLDFIPTIKLQAVIVCCDKGDFESGVKVFERQWESSTTDEALKKQIKQLLKSRSTKDRLITNNTYKVFLDKIVGLLRKINDGFRQPFLLMLAKQVEEVDNTRSKGKKSVGLKRSYQSSDIEKIADLSSEKISKLSHEKEIVLKDKLVELQELKISSFVAKGLSTAKRGYKEDSESDGAPRRLLSTKSGSAGGKYVRPLALGAAVGTGVFGVYHYMGNHKLDLEDVTANLPIAKVSAASAESQPSVWSQTKDHALFLWIHVKPEANSKEVMKAMTKLQKYVDEVSDPKMRDEDDEIWAGVGFGPNFYKQVGGKTRQNYTYAHRKGNLGDMPSSGGDVFVHAKSNQMSKLFELCQVVLKNLPAGSVDKCEDIYSFVYRNGRDLSGFIDGTENAADDESRQEIAVEKESGGSYVITQKWIHDLKLIGTEKDKTLESFVGRQRSDSVEISRKSITSHVARMTSGNNYQAGKPFQIVRQSMPFGTVSNEAGLFFIGYAASPDNHDYMLDRMVGAGGDGHCDDIMKLSKNIKGTYWYFPGASELKKFA